MLAVGKHSIITAISVWHLTRDRCKERTSDHTEQCASATCASATMRFWDNALLRQCASATMRFDVYRGKATVRYRPGKTVFVPPLSPRHLPPPTPSSLVHTTACARDRQHTILARSTVNLPSTPYRRASTSRRSTRQPSHLNSDHRPPRSIPYG